MLATTKICRCCGEERPLRSFRADKGARRATCGRCAKRRAIVTFKPNYPKARAYIFARVERQEHGYSSPCWIWQRAIEERGYGRTVITGYAPRCAHAHRASYEVFVGPIPGGYEVDHLCRVPACVNPAHLEAVTPKVNQERRITADREKAAARIIGAGGVAPTRAAANSNSHNQRPSSHVGRWAN